jgi:hypothetical protein
MQEENIEDQDSLILNEEGVLVENTEVEKLKETNKKLYERAKKAEAEAKALKASTTREIIQPETTTASVPDEVIDLRLDGYSKEEVEFIIKNGGRKALEDKTSYVSIALNTKREQARAEAEANKVTDTSGMTDVERKYTQEQMKNMTAEELAKILPHA